MGKAESGMGEWRCALEGMALVTMVVVEDEEDVDENRLKMSAEGRPRIVSTMVGVEGRTYLALSWYLY